MPKFITIGYGDRAGYYRVAITPVRRHALRSHGALDLRFD
jgi:hypothetical protein